MNKFAPKSEFLKERARSLFKSGYCPHEIGKMLQISEATAHHWLRQGYRTQSAVQAALKKAEAKAIEIYAPAVLPTLAFVPQIKLTPQSKYRMAPHG